MKLNSFVKLLLHKKHAQPICWIDDATLIYYWLGKFVYLNVETKNSNVIGAIKLSFKEKMLSICSFTRRLFRLYIFSPVYNKTKQEILFSFNGYFCSYNLKTKEFTREQKLNHGARRLLSNCLCKNNDVYYGEYPTKNDNTDVCIFKRDDNKEHTAVFRFKPGDIRHVHHISEYHDDLFCFTGDENSETNILRFANKNFTDKPDYLLSGSQNYRACISAFNNGFLYYLTDNPYFENGLFAYNLKSRSVEHMFNVEGSVIYGLQSNGNLYFSTCVEYNLCKDEKNNNVVIKIDGENGGIRDNQSVLYCFDINSNQLRVLAKIKKDFLSIKYFGLGTFMFTCNESSKYLAVFSHALKRNETLFIFDTQER